MVVYKITNKINNKAYIGCTYKQTVESRWKQHLYTAKTFSGQYKSKLYPAMQKYGIVNFEIQVLTKCKNTIQLSEYEKKYIQKYNTVQNGYNISHGGYLGACIKGVDHYAYISISESEGNFILEKYTQEKVNIKELSNQTNLREHIIRRVLKENNIKVKKGTYFSEIENTQIVEKYLQGKGSTALAAEYNTTEDSIKGLLKRNSVNIRTFKESNNIRNQKRIGRFDRQGELLQEYPSIIDALRELGVSKNNGQIALVLNKTTRTYKGFFWKSL